MILSTLTPLDSAMRQGYEGRAVELVKGYAHISTLLKMRAVIGEKIKLLSGPLYSGEAEHLLLAPLCEAVRDAHAHPSTAAVARAAYQLSSAYALVHDISKISQSKDIANQMTLSSLETQPIVETFLRRANLVGQLQDAHKNEKSGYKDQLGIIWRAISLMSSDRVVFDDSETSNLSQGNDKKTVTPLSILYEATSAHFTGEDVKENAANVWKQLLGSLRHGKGTPLDREGRMAYMARLSELLLRVDQMIENARTEDSATSVEPTTYWVDAYTAMYWLLIYLESVAQYDVIFPATDLMVQSQAWVLVIKTQSARLKKLFVDVAQVAASYDIFTAMKFWKEVRSFYHPVLNTSLSVVGDMDSLWADCEGRAAKLLSSYASEQVSTMFESFKTYMQAEFLLPEEDFKMTSDLLDAYSDPTPDKDGAYTAKTGTDLLTNIESVGERIVSVLDRDLLIPGLASSASSIEAAIAYIKRSREVLQLTEETDDIYHALLPDGLKWANPYALEGSVGDMKAAGFTFTDPMQLSYEKYTVVPDNKGNVSAIAAVDWKFINLLMKPFYKIPQMQHFAQERSPESRMLWQGMGDLPVGDVITAEYVAQPIPACYTASRNSNFVNNDFSAYLTLMSGKSGVTSAARDMFRKIAAILDKYPDTYARGILDALAATMFVHKFKDNKWEILSPSVPTVYGMPLQAMIDANSVKLSNSNDDAILKRSIRVRLDNGVAYQFVLHEKMPKPGPMVYVAYPYAKGVYLQVPLLKSIYDDNLERIGQALHVSLKESGTNNTSQFAGYELEDLVNIIRQTGLKPADKKGLSISKASFISTLGWAPYLVNLPHMLCSYQDEEDVLLSDEYKKYAMLSVRVRYDAVERSIYVGGFVDNPVELLSMEDYQRAAESQDPSPLPPSPTHLAGDVQPDAKEPARSENENHPAPKTLGPTPKNPDGTVNEEALAAQAGSVTQGPVLSGDKVQVLNAEAHEQVATAQPNAEAMAGAPAASVQTRGKQGDDAESEDKYWKKISESGDIEDVVKAKECPDGYVPASEDEYRKFVTDKAKEENKPTE